VTKCFLSSRATGVGGRGGGGVSNVKGSTTRETIRDDRVEKDLLRIYNNHVDVEDYKSLRGGGGGR